MKKQQTLPENLEELSNHELLFLLRDLNKKLDDQEQALDRANKQIMSLEEMIRLFKQQKFGPKSEKNDRILNQLNLFDEAEYLSEQEVEEAKEDEVVKKPRKKNTGTNLSNVKEVHIQHPLEVCDVCEGPLKQIGEEIVKILKYEPAKYYVEVHHYPKYLCHACSDEERTYITQAEKAKRLFPQTIATPSLVSSIIHSKYVLSVPIYRQEQELKRKKIGLSRQNMANWVIKAHEQYFKYLVNLMQEDAKQLACIHVDETTVQVLEEKEHHKSYMWALISGKWEDKQMIIYRYHKNREHAFAKELIHPGNTYVHSDAYGAYEKLDTATNVFCMAHARRYIVEALEVNTAYAAFKKMNKKQREEVKASNPGFYQIYDIYQTIKELFDLEATYRDQNYLPEDILMHREKDQRRILDQLFVTLKRIQGDYAPKSKAGKAIQYILNYEEALQNYMVDGRLELSNNRAESMAIKPFVIGRKNWQFANTIKGAHASAGIYSLVNSANLNHLDVEAYLSYVLETMSQADEDQDWHHLLPYAPEMIERFKVK